MPTLDENNYVLAVINISTLVSMYTDTQKYLSQIVQ